MRDERAGGRAAGDRLHRGRLDLDESLLGHRLAKRGDQLRAAEEDGQRLGIAEQVDVALAVALFDVGQAVPLLGGRQQALGQKRELFGEDGQLAGLGVAEAAVDADQVAQVELFDQAPAEIADLLLADEDLDVVGPVAEVEEDDLALPAPEHDPAGDADGRTRARSVGLGRRQRAHRGDRLVPVESLSPGIDPQARRFAPASRCERLPGSRVARRPLFPLLLLDSSLRANWRQIVVFRRAWSTATGLTAPSRVGPLILGKSVPR